MTALESVIIFIATAACLLAIGDGLAGSFPFLADKILANLGLMELIK